MALTGKRRGGLTRYKLLINLCKSGSLLSSELQHTFRVSYLALIETYSLSNSYNSYTIRRLCSIKYSASSDHTRFSIPDIAKHTDNEKFISRTHPYLPNASTGRSLSVSCSYLARSGWNLAQLSFPQKGNCVRRIKTTR